MSSLQSITDLDAAILYIEEKFRASESITLDYEEWRAVVLAIESNNKIDKETERELSRLEDEVSDLEDDLEFAHNKIDNLEEQLKQGKS